MIVARSLPVITDMTVQHGSRDWRSTWKQRLESIRANSDIVNRRTGNLLATDPNKLWQEIYCILSDKKYDPKTNFDYAFKVIRANNLDAAQIINDHDFGTCRTILIDAIHSGKSDAVELVLNKLTADEKAKIINLGDNRDIAKSLGLVITPLFAASWSKSEEATLMIDKLIEHGADPKGISYCYSDHPLPIHNAAKYGTVAVLDKFLTLNPELINVPIDENAQLNVGSTPLHFAVEMGTFDKVKLLIERGADVNAVDKDGMTPMMIAAARGDTKIIDLLEQAGADINYRVPGQLLQASIANTPLAQAVDMERYDAVRYLLNKGVNVQESKVRDKPLLRYLAEPRNRNRLALRLMIAGLISKGDEFKTVTRGIEEVNAELLVKLARLNLAATKQDRKASSLAVKALAAKIDGKTFKLSLTNFENTKEFIERNFSSSYTQRGDAVSIRALEFAKELASYIKHS